MIRLIAIAFLLALAVVLFKYRANQKLQKSVVIVSVCGLLAYIAWVMAMELFR